MSFPLLRRPWAAALGHGVPRQLYSVQLVSWGSLLLVAWCVSLLVSCGSPAPEPRAATQESSLGGGNAEPTLPDDARGARLFDNWHAEKKVGDAFRIDARDTPELDGRGGPHGNGTLSDDAGRPLANTGHDYRLKNLFGWDLRGARGIYAPEHQNKPFVLEHDLLNDTRSPAELRTWFERGGSGLPAYGSVLDDTDLDQLVAFVVKTRSGELARPEQIFGLDAAAPKHYVLHPGGNAERGRARYAKACAECHGQDGRELAIDTTESVGTLGRTAGYEVWFKIAHGHPGSDMLREVSEPSGEAQASAILDILAALCDREHFPQLAVPNAADVETGDLRCGGYLR